MSESVAVNLNAEVEVRLTDTGRRIFDAHHGGDVRAGDVERMELWSLMDIFGPHISFGMHEVPFVDNELVILGQPYDWVVRVGDKSEEAPR